jgi:hypothetical protein
VLDCMADIDWDYEIHIFGPRLPLDGGLVDDMKSMDKMMEVVYYWKTNDGGSIWRLRKLVPRITTYRPAAESGTFIPADIGWREDTLV